MHKKLVTKVNFCFKLSLHDTTKGIRPVYLHLHTAQAQIYGDVRLSKPKQRTLKRLHYKNESLIKSGVLNVDSKVSSTLFWGKKIVGPSGISTLFPAIIVL